MLSISRSTERAVHSTSFSLMFILIIASIFGVYVGLVTTGQQCNSQLSSQIGSPADLCLKTITINYSDENSSEAIVPVLLMKPGSTASISILYEPHPDKGSGFNPQSKLTSFNIPTAVSAISGEPNISAVAFSEGMQVYQYDNWTIYKYNITSSNESSGYYAMIIPFGPTIYPALVIGSNSFVLNLTRMSLWGYVGAIQTGETVIPSILVGTSNLAIVNVTIPESQYCHTRACNIIASSEYYEG